MAAVDIGIGHDDDLVVAELIDVKLLAQSGAERRDDGRELVVAVDLVGARLFDVEHLAPERQNGLEARVAPLRGRAACAVALDDVELRQRRVAVVAVAQLVGHVEALEPVFAADIFARTARGFAGARGRERFFDDHAADGGVFLQKLRQAVEHDGIDERAHLGVAELGLRLALELGVRELDGDDRREALAAVLAGDAVALLEDAGLFAVGIERAGERSLEAGLVHAALRRVDVVGEGDDDFVVAVVILQRDLAHGVAALAGHINSFRVQGGLVAIDEVHKLADAALIAHRLAHGLLAALVGDGDAQAGVQKRLLAHAHVQRLIVVDRVLEHDGVGLEAHGRAGVVRLADNGHGLRDIAAGKLHLIDLPVFMHVHFQPLGQRVDDRGADAVQAAGDLIATAAELAARVQHGEYDLERGLAGLRLDVHGDTAAVIADADDVAGLDGQLDVAAVARERLVDGVVDDLIHQVVQAG